MDRAVKKMALNAVSGCILALSASAAFSGAMGPEVTNPGGVYAGVFGGWGAVSSTDVNQYGTAFFSEVEGGPLAVDAFGRAGSDSTGIIGGHVGFAWPNTMGMYLPVTAAVEIEGYYMSRVNLEAHDLNNNTDRLPEHDFLVNYPIKTGVFLVNAVLNANNSMFGKFKPYVGFGIGSALQSVSGATSVQVAPPELGVNHYNANTDDKAFAFAAQPKVGAHFDLTDHVSVFAEYRFLYLSQTNYTFGSTVTPTHAVTAPWLVSIKPQHYNMGTIGIDFDA